MAFPITPGVEFSDLARMDMVEGDFEDLTAGSAALCVRVATLF